MPFKGGTDHPCGLPCHLPQGSKRKAPFLPCFPSNPLTGLTSALARRGCSLIEVAGPTFPPSAPLSVASPLPLAHTDRSRFSTHQKFLDSEKWLGVGCLEMGKTFQYRKRQHRAEAWVLPRNPTATSTQVFAPFPFGSFPCLVSDLSFLLVLKKQLISFSLGSRLCEAGQQGVRRP